MKISSLNLSIKFTGLNKIEMLLVQKWSAARARYSKTSIKV
jgi:hypothetical protein